MEALVILLLSAAAPFLAQGSERWLGLAPCELCLWQRWPYWVAAGLALLALLLAGRARQVLLRLAGIAVLVSGAIAILHIGVEQHWWPSPLPGCQAPTASGGTQSFEEMMRGLPAAPTKPCDAATYLIPGLPLSIPMLNLIYALAVGSFALVLARRLTPRVTL